MLMTELIIGIRTTSKQNTNTQARPMEWVCHMPGPSERNELNFFFVGGGGGAGKRSFSLKNAQNVRCELCN